MRETDIDNTWCDVKLDGKVIGMYHSIDEWNDFAGDELGVIHSWVELVDVGYEVCFYKAPNVAFDND